MRTLVIATMATAVAMGTVLFASVDSKKTGAMTLGSQVVADAAGIKPVRYPLHKPTVETQLLDEETGKCIAVYLPASQGLRACGGNNMPKAKRLMEEGLTFNDIFLNPDRYLGK